MTHKIRGVRVDGIVDTSANIQVSGGQEPRSEAEVFGHGHGRTAIYWSENLKA